MMIKFTIYGEPVAQARPRFNSFTKRAYDPAKSSNFKKYIRCEALKYKPTKLLEGSLHLTVAIYRSMPQMSKKKAELALSEKLKPITKPDLDNYVKSIKDALKGIMWQDDSQVTDMVVKKRYTDKPRVEVEISEA